MSAGGMGSGHGGRGSTSQDFELNLASIIDCFTVLISFMLVTASFLSIGILDAGIAAAGATSTGAEPPPINLTIELKRDFSIAFKVVGKESRNDLIAPANGTWNSEQLQGQLNGLKARFPGLSAATLQADNQVEYLGVVKMLEVTRRSIPAVLLGGF